MRNHICRHCGKAFVPQPGKLGFIDECPMCVEERQAEAEVNVKSEETMELLKESIRASRSAPKNPTRPGK